MRPRRHCERCNSSRYTLGCVVDDLWWREEDAEYIRTRGERYAGATGIEPGRTLKAAADRHAIVRDPDPKSRVAALRIIGFSPSAGFVITVIPTRSDRAGATAWKTSGADLRACEGQDES